MKNMLQYLLIYLIIVISIFSFYYNVTHEHKEQLAINRGERNGVEYLNTIYHLSNSIVEYKYAVDREANKEQIRSIKEQFFTSRDKLLLLQQKYPKFKNTQLNSYLEFENRTSFDDESCNALLDYINHENYRIGDISSILFDTDRKIHFLGSLITHYLPEYIISITLTHNIVKEFNKNREISSFKKDFYAEQSKLVNLSSDELKEIIKLLKPYKNTKKLLYLIDEIQKELLKLSAYIAEIQKWDINSTELTNYLKISQRVVKLSYRLNNENSYILKSSLKEREANLEKRILFNRFLIIFIFVLITLIIFYYYRAVVALEKEKQKTLDALEFKSRFLSNMSHEIRTPLNGIIGLTHVIFKTELNTKQKDVVNKIKYASDLLLNVINDILDISKIESGKMSIEKTSFNLKELVENLHDLLSTQATSKGITLKVDSEGLETPYLLGDSLRISQVITNLLSNAIKFTPNGEVKLRVQNKDNSLVRFSVEDTGIGLKAEQLDTLFQEFTQADMSTSREYGGTGLGLAIVKNLVELMDGRIWIESEYGVGSTFTFEIPLESSSSNAETEIVEDTLSLEEILNSLESKKILVAEDNKMNQTLLSMLLEDTQLKLEFASDGKITIEMFQDADYDLVLMDIQMPNMNGYDATIAIREIDSEIPIIALSANVMQEEISKALESGMNDYLAKPIDIDKLNAMLLKYLPH